MADVKTHVTVKVDKAVLNRELRERDGAVGKVIAGFAGEVTKEIKSTTRAAAGGAWWPVETKILQGPRGTFFVTTVKRNRPHPIDARRAPNLVFFWEREQVIFKGPHVNHPGSAPPEKLILSGLEKAGRKMTFLGAAANTK